MQSSLAMPFPQHHCYYMHASRYWSFNTFLWQLNRSKLL